MRDPLDDYRKKRDFGATPEPAPGEQDATRPGNAFVVHRHEARQLHYDLRLEHDGVLKSWAVPRGFSYDRSEKRLAVRTEDHPIEYEHFSGRIPKGQYGAGTMAIWDRGTYELVKIPTWEQSLEKGELKVVLRGRRLRGEWHLVRTTQGKNTWLLFKSKDRFAGPDRDSVLGVDLDAAVDGDVTLPLDAMRPGGERGAFRDPGFLFEMQFEGRRTFARKAGDEVMLTAVDDVPAAIADGLRALRGDTALLDGVLVATDASGRPSRAALEQALAAGGDGVALYTFDLLQWEDYDLRALPLVDRKAGLRAIVAERPGVLFVDHVAGDGPALLQAIADTGLPGAVAKRATSCYVEGPSDDWLVVPADAAPEADAAGAPRGAVSLAPSRFKPTNLDKVYWPAEGYTKGDLIAYYAAVADVILPHLQDRPVHFNRFPDGIDGKSFYQREVKEGTPDWVGRADVPHDDEVVPHHVVADRDTLLYAANLGSIDLHPWLSRVGSFYEPDFAVIDLDPKDAPWQHVVRIARAAGKLLRGIGLRPLLKTSGKTGIHVFVPLIGGYSYDHSKMFCEAVARVLVRELPEIATVERLPQNRDGKVYVDFLQNRKSQTIVPPYSARPVRGASVSAPLTWDELEDSELTPQRFTIKTMPQRVAERGDLFHKALTDKQDLMPAIAALEDVLKNG
ncbi:MAG: non-homologous end-joining DNA ligase [Planctomycetes bacterium]|nr:non-homologous end-joining DNA ligase [Planctomycetota bacterium]